LLADGVYFSTGPDQCLFMFSPDQFARFCKRYRKKPPAGMTPRAFDRVFFGSVKNQTPDKQGRVTIPPELRKYASLEREAVVVGLEKRLELWDAGHWQAYLDTHQEQYASLQDGLR